MNYTQTNSAGYTQEEVEAIVRYEVSKRAKTAEGAGGPCPACRHYDIEPTEAPCKECSNNHLSFFEPA